MTEYLTEQEQIELLKTWIKQYSLVILTGVVVAVVGITGWRYWQQRQIKILSHASSVYDEMLTKRAQNDTRETQVQAQKLFSHYGSTTYAQFAALLLAREAVNNKNYAEASTQLQWVIDHSKTPSLRQIARLRMARLLIGQQQPQQALKLLDKIDDNNFTGMIEEVRGDAYFAMKDKALARTSYQKALAELPNAESVRPLLQMKYDNLATN